MPDPNYGASKWSTGATVDHLLVLIEGLLPLHPHVLIELSDECFYSPVELVLTQRWFLPYFPRATATITSWRWDPCICPVVEGLWFSHLLWSLVLLGENTTIVAVTLPGVRFPQVPGKWDGTPLSYCLPCAFQGVLLLWFWNSQNCFTTWWMIKRVWCFIYTWCESIILIATEIMQVQARTLFRNSLY